MIWRISFLAICAILAAPISASELRGTGDLGIVVERASGSVLIVDTSKRTAMARVEGLGDYLDAQRTRVGIIAAFARVFEHADVLITPIHATSPAVIGDTSETFRNRVLTYTVPQDMAGLPAVAVPAGTDDLGLPIGIQLTGPAGSEHALLRAAERVAN